MYIDTYIYIYLCIYIDYTDIGNQQSESTVNPESIAGLQSQHGGRNHHQESLCTLAAGLNGNIIEFNGGYLWISGVKNRIKSIQVVHVFTMGHNGTIIELDGNRMAITWHMSHLYVHHGELGNPHHANGGFDQKLIDSMGDCPFAQDLSLLQIKVQGMWRQCHVEAENHGPLSKD